TAAAASGTFTVTRTISDPASASSMHCRAVAAASAVSVIVIDWTTTGAPPPTRTRPTLTPAVLWRRAVVGIRVIISSVDGRPAVTQQNAADLVGPRQGEVGRIVV